MDDCFVNIDRAASWRDLKKCLLSQLQTIVLLFNNCETRREKIISEAKLFIEGHFKENIDQADLLRKLSISRSWFKTAFKEETGLTFTRYLRKRRIEEACMILRSTDNPLWKIAHDSGLRTDRTMRRTFQEELGLSPQAYRRNHVAG
jgi:AraC-like DNA-binding protein